jgi:hypothetical protein
MKFSIYSVVFLLIINFTACVVGEDPIEANNLTADESFSVPVLNVIETTYEEVCPTDRSWGVIDALPNTVVTAFSIYLHASPDFSGVANSHDYYSTLLNRTVKKQITGSLYDTGNHQFLYDCHGSNIGGQHEPGFKIEVIY